MHAHDNMSDVIISLGSNIERERHIPEAIRLIRRNRHIDVHKVSRVFESDAAGGPDDAPPFFNAAVWACTELEPEDVRDALRHIEGVLGRERTDDPDAARTICLGRPVVCSVNMSMIPKSSMCVRTSSRSRRGMLLIGPRRRSDWEQVPPGHESMCRMTLLIRAS